MDKTEDKNAEEFARGEVGRLGVEGIRPQFPNISTSQNPLGRLVEIQFPEPHSEIQVRKIWGSARKQQF